MARTTNGGTALARHPSETLSRWEPWADFDQMRRQMDDLFGRFFGYTPLSRLIPSIPGTSYTGGYDLSPDIFETQDELIFLLPIPGMEPNDLNIEATADTLSIRGEHKPFYQNENAVQHRQSFWSSARGPFQWSYTLPVEIDPNAIKATYRNGLLELHLPKSEAARPKAVKVNVVTK